MGPDYYELVIAAADKLILLEPELDTPEGRFLSALADALVEYEEVVFPLAATASMEQGEPHAES